MALTAGTVSSGMIDGRCFSVLDFMKNDGFSARNISQKKIHCKYVKTCREVWGSSQNTDEWGSCPDGGLKRARPPRSDPHFPGMVQMEEEFVLFFGCRDPEGEENCRTCLSTISIDFCQFFVWTERIKAIMSKHCFAEINMAGGHFFPCHE